MSKVVKYTCTLRLYIYIYIYTHDQLNTRHFIIIFLNFFEGGGAQNSSLPPGARYPRYATGESERVATGRAGGFTAGPEYEWVPTGGGCTHLSINRYQ